MNLGKPAYLKTQCEKFVCVESRGSGSTPQIVAKSVQLNSTNSRKVTVTVNERTGVDNVKCMAFCFELNKKKYFLVVNGDQLGFEETFTSDEKFWFKWGEKTGKWRTVRSVAKPDMSLMIESNNSNVIICSQPVQLFRIFFQEESRPEMIQDSRPMYLQTRLRQYMWDGSKDGSTSQMVVEKIKISNDRNPRRGNKRIRRVYRSKETTE